MDLMEFSMSEGNDTLTGDENFLPPKLMQTPVVVNSILKPSTKGNLMQLHTPKPQQKHLKVKFETPRSVKEVTPTRYEQIADLDEKENWIERTTIVTKTDHLLNIECAKGIVNNIVENLPLSESESVAESDKPTTVSEEEEEAFFDASEETDKATPDTLGHPTPTPTSADTFPAPQDTAVSAKQQVTDVSTVSVPQGATGILEVSMDCTEEDVLATEEPMDCDETAMEIDITVISNKTLIEDKATSPKTAQVNPVTVVTSPPLPASGGVYKIDYDNLDSFNPFQTKGDISNSPVRTAEAHNKSAAGEKIDTEQVPLNTDTVESVSDSQAPEGVLGIEAEVATDLLSEVLPEVDGDQVQGIYNINFDDKTDPFATKSQVQNSPSSVDTFAAKSQVQNSPLAADPFATKSQVQNSPAVDLFATKSQVQNSPPAADPFATKSQIQNSPSAADPFATKSQIQNSPPAADPIATKSQVQNSPLAADPFATKSQVQNSPPAADPFATKLQVQNSPPSADPLVTKLQAHNNDMSTDIATVCDTQSLPVNGDITTPQRPMKIDKDDPFSTKSKVANSPLQASVLNNSNPFATKSNVCNSPIQPPNEEKMTLTVPTVPDSSTLNSYNPVASLTSEGSVITPKKSLSIEEDTLSVQSKMANSPPSKNPAPATETALVLENDPFTTKSKVPNSPAPSATVKIDALTDLDPFTTKSKVPNSPPPSVTSTEDPLIDPFTTKSKVPNSPPPSALSKEEPSSDPFTTKSKVPNSPISSETVKKDFMEDLDPFNTKSKVPNSPPPSALSKEEPMSDPFTTKSKVPNSPISAATMKKDPLADLNPFTTKSKVPTSPSPQAPTEIRVSDSTAATSKVPEMTSQTTQQVNPPPSLENKFPEAAFQNIASRNTLPESASNVPDFSDEEFRPATDCIFNDSSFLDVLEKFGSSNSESKMSDLSRMSLYVKFDPLVNLPASDPRRASMNLYKRASIMNMPRKSLSGKSLSEVCNAEESMLLMGTPPKQMSQRLTNVASRIHHTGFTPGSTPTTPKAFKPQLDLLCANTPPRSVKKSTTPAPVKVNSNLPEDPADNLAAGTDDNIIEVLQYTDKDMCEVKSSLFLEFQGQKLLLEREWTKVVDKLKAKIEEQNRTLAKKQADIELMGNISKELEIVVEGLIQEKEKEKDLTIELKKDREQAVQDTQSLEKAFSELHRRNEKLKETLSGHVKNQETLTAHAKELQKSLTAVKTESKEKIVELTQQLSKVKSDLSLITTSSEARTKRDKMQIESLQKTVDQKMSENKELAQMCDELLAKVSK